MSLAFNLYHDQIGAGGSTASALTRRHRLLYVRHGRVAINGRTMSADEATYCDGPLTLKSAGEWSHGDGSWPSPTRSRNFTPALACYRACGCRA